MANSRDFVAWDNSDRTETYDDWGTLMQTEVDRYDYSGNYTYTDVYDGHGNWCYSYVK